MTIYMYMCACMHDCVCVCVWGGGWGGWRGGGAEQVVYIVVETPALVVVRSEPHQCRCFFPSHHLPAHPAVKWYLA